MPAIDFRQFSYYPCLQCTEPEQIAYRELSDEDKDAILPIVELSQIKNEASFDSTIDAVRTLFGGRPFILDLSKDAAPEAYVPKKNADHAKIAKLQTAQDGYNTALLAHMMPTDGFAKWRECASEFANAIPALQFTDPASQAKNILRQAAQFWKAGVERLAIRVTPETSEEIFPIIGQIVAFLDSAEQLLLIVDCGQGRQQIPERIEFAKRSVARVFEELDPSQVLKLSAVCLHDSYTSPPETAKIYESHSRELWREASTGFPFLFGDYSGHRRLKKSTTYMPGDWKAQVVYALPESWIVYRHDNAQDPEGWIVGSKAILKHGSFDDGLNCWGSQLVKSAAVGKLDPYGSARFWHAAKINMHLYRQIRYTDEAADGSDVI
ncbi:beta family protein [Rhizobium leguminosarum]